MSYSERIEEWAEQHKKKLTVLYIIWCIGLITVAMLFGAGVLELRAINFDPQQVPVGLMDKEMDTPSNEELKNEIDILIEKIEEKP